MSRTPPARRARIYAEVVAFGLLPALWLLVLLVAWPGDDRTGFDLRHAFLPAAHDVLRFESPYPQAGDPSIAGRYAYVYSPVLAYVTTPLTVLPEGVAVTVGVVGSFLAVIAVLALAGVRDWRCYGVALAWAPVANSAGNVTVSLAVAVVLAAAWRYRAHEHRSAALAGVAVALKSFAWPMLAWPVVMRRWGGATTAVGTAVLLSLGSWAIIGFAGLTDYPDLVRAVTSAQEHDSYSVSSVLLDLGVDSVPARAVLVVATAALVGWAVVLARRGHETRAFVALLLGSLTATPLLWQHYLVLLLVALAITQPRLTWVWLLPLALYLAPMTGNGAQWQTMLVPAVTAVVGVACLLPAGGYGASSAPSRATSPSW